MGIITSVIIPARNERYLQATLDSLYTNAGADIETIVILDGITEYPLNKEYPNLTLISNKEPLGIRECINKGVGASHGDYLLKLDSHCVFGDNFVSTLLLNIASNWVVVARRWTLDLETMKPQPRNVDYYYLSCPWTHPRGMMMQSCPWISRTEKYLNTQIDDLMCFQGSMWMMSKKHWNNLGGLEIGKETYAEHHEISMKTWLSGGKVIINKNTWYAHPRQNTGGYKMDMNTVYSDHDHSARYWVMQPGFKELIDRFWPLPTEHNRHRTEKYFWPENWKEYL
jgi:glycosyltransferase involved in cell wall biosynthesis